jgi:hypothetical protein
MLVVFMRVDVAVPVAVAVAVAVAGTLEVAAAQEF